MLYNNCSLCTSRYCKVPVTDEYFYILLHFYNRLYFIFDYIFIVLLVFDKKCLSLHISLAIVLETYRNYRFFFWKKMGCSIKKHSSVSETLRCHLALFFQTKFFFIRIRKICKRNIPRNVFKKTIVLIDYENSHL